MADDALPESEIEDTEGDEREDDSERLSEVHDRAMRRFDSVAPFQQELRAQSLEARRFVTIPGAMWEGVYGIQFENAPRPEVDKITKPLEKIETDYNENRIIADFVPADDNADEDTAETLDGLYRADLDHFQSMQAFDNAFGEALRGGFGAWRVTTDLADPDDPDSDEQRVNPGHTIVDADQSVYFDPGSKLYDKRDAKWCFVITADPRGTAEEKWGEDVAPWPLQNWKWAWDWYSPTVVRTAEYYETEKVKDRRITLTNKLTDSTQVFWGRDVEPKEIADLVAQGWEKKERKAERTRIHKYVMNGSCVLKDCGFVPGDLIPVVPVYYRRDFVDNMERWSGYVLKKMDPQRILNTGVAKVVETQSLAPYEVPIVAPEQMDMTIAEQWARGNIDRLPFRYLKPLVNPDGSFAVTGVIGKVEPPQLQPTTAALLQFGVDQLSDDDANMEQPPGNTSFDTLDMATTRIDARSAKPLDNMRKSMERGAEIYKAQARPTYFQPGRKVNTLTDDGQDGTATLHEPFVDSNGVYRIRNDLDRGKYKVVATVQEATATKRQRTVRQCLALGQATEAVDPQLSKAYFLTASMNMDGEGQDDLRKFARREAIGLGLTDPTPEEAQQIAQASQGQQQPDPAQIALMAQAGKFQADSQLSQAKAVQTMADAHLKEAQAQAVGGPEKAPEVPTGLQAANDAASIAETSASADLKRAQAAHLMHDIHNKSIKTGAEIAAQEHAQRMAEQQNNNAA